MLSLPEFKWEEQKINGDIKLMMLNYCLRELMRKKDENLNNSSKKI